jgi:L-arabinose isomerase
MSINLKQYEVWFVTGSQHLYGPETLKKVAEHSQEIAKALNIAPAIPVKVVFKPVLVTPDLVTELCQAANNAEVHRPDHLVPHVLAIENVDQRPQAAPQTRRASAHAI